MKLPYDHVPPPTQSVKAEVLLIKGVYVHSYRTRKEVIVLVITEN